MDRRLFFLMHRAHRALMAFGNAQTHEVLGISAAQLGALQFVAKSPGSSLTALADVFDLNKSAVTGLVQRMEKADFIHRRPNPKDGRGSLLFVTSKGDEVLAKSKALIRRLNAELTEGFRADEVETILRFMNVIVERYGTDVSEEET
jgi:MarR family transcriptional regulator, organic hydroperoxide resistance regulator